MLDALKPRLIDTQKRVILPGEVLQALGAGPGDYVAFVVNGDGVKLRKVKLTLE